MFAIFDLVSNELVGVVFNAVHSYCVLQVCMLLILAPQNHTPCVHAKCMLL